jgi:hypothetical protein
MHRLLVLGLLPLFLGQPVGQPAPAPAAWSVALDPPAAHAAGVRWTISLSANYCGGYDIGDGVFIQPEAPFAFPDPVAADGVLFEGGAADVHLENGVLRVVPSSDRLWSQVCIQGERPLTVELQPSVGLTNPDAGTYDVGVWIGAGQQVQLPVVVTD